MITLRKNSTERKKYEKIQKCRAIYQKVLEVYRAGWLILTKTEVSVRETGTGLELIGPEN